MAAVRGNLWDLASGFPSSGRAGNTLRLRKAIILTSQKEKGDHLFVLTYSSYALNQIPNDYTVEVRNSILKSRDITLPTKVRLVKAMVFPVVMYGCESWTVKKAER